MKNKFFKISILIAVAVAIIAGVVARRSKNGGDASNKVLYATAQRGPLVISLEENGEIKPSEQITIKSEIEGHTTILYIVPEGTIVKKGDLLVELDVAEKLDALVNQQIEVENAESAFTLKSEDLEIAKNQAASDTEMAQQDLEFAKEDLIKYTEGEYPNKLKDVQGQLALAEQELEQSKQKYEWSKKLFAEDFISESELKSDELSWKHSALSLETSRGNLFLLENYTHKRQLAELQTSVKQKTAALERTLRRTRSNIIQAESSLRAKESELNRQRQKLEKLTNQIARAHITAPMDGQVIYATSVQRRWGNDEPLKEGADVWQRRDLIYLPTADTFIASVNIHESALKSVSTGMPVTVRSDAIPGKEFSGILTKVSPMADTGRRWLNPDLKEYPAEILLSGGIGELKSGMSCHAQIILDEFDDAVSVPLQCVVEIAEKSYVWVRHPGAPDEKREVVTGLDNNSVVHIVSGLSGGEEVCLVPPLEGSVRQKKGRIEQKNEPPQKPAPKP